MHRLMPGFLALGWLMMAQARPFQLQSFTLQDLLQPSEDVSRQLQETISEIGIFAVSHDVLKEERAHPLQALVRCIDSGAAAGHTQDAVMKDLTVRTTLAVETAGNTSLPFADELQGKCPDFVKTSDALRAAAAAIGNAYAHFLDASSTGGQASSELPGSFQDAVTHAHSLEHFHVFRRQSERQADAPPTLSMHADLGLFIVMTPPQYFDLVTSAEHFAEPGFRLQLQSGEVVTPEFPAGSLLVMNGVGSAQWVQSPIAQKLYAPPHEVILPSLKNLGRAWYGRMYLPPKAATNQEQQTFAQYWQKGMEAVTTSGDQQAVVEGSHRQLLVDQGNCSLGFLYCWMGCRPIVNVTTCPIKDIVCTDPAGKSWPQQFINETTQKPTHCFSCKLRCNASVADDDQTKELPEPDVKPDNFAIANAPQIITALASALMMLALL